MPAAADPEELLLPKKPSPDPEFVPTEEAGTAAGGKAFGAAVGAAKLGGQANGVGATGGRGTAAAVVGLGVWPNTEKEAGAFDAAAAAAGGEVFPRSVLRRGVLLYCGREPKVKALPGGAMGTEKESVAGAAAGGGCMSAWSSPPPAWSKAEARLTRVEPVGLKVAGSTAWELLSSIAGARGATVERGAWPCFPGLPCAKP